ncbi:MAG: response regulator transcription factor, partial [Pseudomonadota bacterium]
DHGLVLDGLTARLRRCAEIEIVGTASNGEDGIALATSLKPDVVLMDINMPALSGIEAAEILGERGADTALIILSVHDDREYILDAARAGAKGYLLKNASAGDMIDAIRTVHRGGTFYSPEIAEILLQAPRDSVPLTRREQTIIRLLANGLSSRDMAAQLRISVRTVETHRRNIKQKLEISSTPALVRYAIDYGLID